MLSNALVSVIMPVFYSAECLKKTLESLLNIDYPKRRIEVFFCYYPSQDSTFDIIESFSHQYGAEYAAVTIIECKQRGLSYARNIGIRRSSGDLIFLLDDDVELRCETFRYALRILVNNPNAAVACFPYITVKPSLLEQAAFFRFEDRVVSTKTFPPGSSMIRKKVLDEVGLFNEKLGYPFALHEELEMAARIKKAGYEIVIDGTLIQKHLAKISREMEYSDVNLSGNYRANKSKLESASWRAYFTTGADSYRIVLRNAPKAWSFELSMYILLPIALVALVGISIATGCYLASLLFISFIAVSIIVYWRAFDFRRLKLAAVVVMGRILRGYGYTARIFWLSLSKRQKI